MSEVRARPIPGPARLRGEVRVPGSKSLTNRYLVLALLAARPVVVEGALASEDCERLLAALGLLGFEVGREADRLKLVPGIRPRRAAIDCGASGTMLRFLTAALATLPGNYQLDGSPRLRQRPLAPLVTSLRALGADVDWLGEPGHAPLAIAGGGLAPGLVRLDAGESSQYLSALVMALATLAAPSTVEVEALTSSPYFDLTLAALAAFGGSAERSGRRVRVAPGLPGAARVEVEADYSSAAYWAAAAALSSGRVRLRGLGRRSLQPDRRFLELLGRMGADVVWSGDQVEVAGSGRLVALADDLSDMPDQAPTLAVLAPWASGETRIRNVGHLRWKESDRLAAVAEALSAAGAEARIEGDDLLVPGVWARRAPPATPFELEPRADHRLAMSFAVFGLRRPGTTILDPGTVAKSYPDFWRHFDLLVKTA